MMAATSGTVVQVGERGGEPLAEPFEAVLGDDVRPAAAAELEQPLAIPQQPDGSRRELLRRESSEHDPSARRADEVRHAAGERLARGDAESLLQRRQDEQACATELRCNGRDWAGDLDAGLLARVADRADEPQARLWHVAPNRVERGPQQPDVLARIVDASDEDDRRALEPRDPVVVRLGRKRVRVDGDGQYADLVLGAPARGRQPRPAGRRGGEDEGGSP